VWDRPRQYRAILCEPIVVRSTGDPVEAEHEALAQMARVIEGQVAANLPVWFNFTPAWSAS
jgi:hypothetical protein